MEKLKKGFGAFLVPLLSILLAFIIGGIIMAALGADPFLAVKYLFRGAFGSADQGHAPHVHGSVRVLRV